jgi:hypothetical protein
MTSPYARTGCAFWVASCRSPVSSQNDLQEQSCPFFPFQIIVKLATYSSVFSGFLPI